MNEAQALVCVCVYDLAQRGGGGGGGGVENRGRGCEGGDVLTIKVTGKVAEP